MKKLLFGSGLSEKSLPNTEKGGATDKVQQ